MLTDQRRFRGVLSGIDTVDDKSVMKYPINLKINSAMGLDACGIRPKLYSTTNYCFPEKPLIIEHVDGPMKISWGFEWFRHSGR